MRNNKFGNVILISSVNAKKGALGQTNYASSKSAMFGFTKSLALENASKNIMINCICPGYINTSMTKEINENTEIILGEKIFKTNTERVVDNLLNNNSNQISSEELVVNFSQVAEPLIAKYKEVYKATQAETNEATKQIQEKVKKVAEEYNNSDNKDGDVLKQKLIDILEVQLKDY
jgi:short-subunit dehydrogenase